jgi:hypothetical protein
MSLLLHTYYCPLCVQGMDSPDLLQKVLSLENKVAELTHDLERQRVCRTVIG